MSKNDFISKSRKINCREANTLMQGYIAGKLTDRELASFLNHVENCTACYDELETNFMVDQTVRYLNEDSNDSFDLRPMLQIDLKKRREDLLYKRRAHGLQRMIIVITVILIVFLILDLTGIFRLTVFMQILMELLGI